MKEFLHKHIEKILIIAGVVVSVAGNLIAWAVGIPRIGSLYAAILLLFTIALLASGLIMLSNKIKKKAPRMSMAIRYFVAFFGIIMVLIDITWFVGGILG